MERLLLKLQCRLLAFGCAGTGCANIFDRGSRTEVYKLLWESTMALTCLMKILLLRDYCAWPAVLPASVASKPAPAPKRGADAAAKGAAEQTPPSPAALVSCCKVLARGGAGSILLLYTLGQHV